MKVRWEEMLPDELMEAIRAHPVCYCAYGLAEPHGAYNALGLDWLKAQAIVELAANEHGGVVAPPFAWHVQERVAFDWCAKMGIRHPLASSIPADLFYQTVLYQIRAIDARGFHVGILVTGHYGGLENDMRLLCDYYTRATGSPLQLFAAADWELIRFENYRGDHAGICETSQLMFLRPELVDLTRRDQDSPDGPWAGSDLPLPDGRMPSAELGGNIVRSQIERLGEVQTELLAAYSPVSDWKAPSLERTQNIWHEFEFLTRDYWWCSLTWEEYRAGKRPEFPGWDATDL